MTDRGHEDLPAAAAAVLLAALDGHNPNIEHHPDGTIVARPGRGKSDLDFTVEDLADIPVAAQFKYRALAQEAVFLVRWIASRYNIPKDELADTFRQNLQGQIAGQIDEDGDADG